MFAAVKGHSKLVEILTQRGACVDTKKEDEKTALMLATKTGNIETIEILLRARENVNSEDTDGHTALMFARDKKFYRDPGRCRCRYKPPVQGYDSIDACN